MGTEASHEVSDEFDSGKTSLLTNSEVITVESAYAHIVDSKHQVHIDQIYHYMPFSKASKFNEILQSKDVFASPQHFVGFIGKLIRLPNTQGLEIIWEYLHDGHGEDTMSSFLGMMCEVAFNSHVTEHDRDIYVTRTSKNIRRFIEKKTLVSRSSETAISLFDFKNWISDYAPQMMSSVETILTLRLLKSYSPSFEPYVAPSLSAPSSLLSPIDILPLSFFKKSLQGAWQRLYTSESDGRSMNRLMHSIIGYDGPHCIVIRSSKARDCVFGVYSSDKWRESNRFFGSSEDFLFSLKPRLRIFRSQNSSNGCYRWLNTKSLGLPHGIGIGGTPALDQFRLFISESFDECIVNSSCLTFEPGKLASVDPSSNVIVSTLFGEEITIEDSSKSSGPLYLDIDVIEVWGCGGERFISKAIEAQTEARQLAARTLDKARTCDKATFFNNGFDQEFLLSKTLQHRKEAVERNDP